MKKNLVEARRERAKERYRTAWSIYRFHSDPVERKKFEGMFEELRPQIEAGDPQEWEKFQRSLLAGGGDSPSNSRGVRFM